MFRINFKDSTQITSKIQYNILLVFVLFFQYFSKSWLVSKIIKRRNFSYVKIFDNVVKHWNNVILLWMTLLVLKKLNKNVFIISSKFQLWTFLRKNWQRCYFGHFYSQSSIQISKIIYVEKWSTNFRYFAPYNNKFNSI